jgi:putative RNA 2'-phosphotransferase
VEERRLLRLSKYLSYYLRHRPGELGLALAPGGWVPVEALLAASARKGFPIAREELEEVVTRNDKRRFAFDGSGTFIRARQGHSTPVDLGLEPVEPPPTLYHGTRDKSLPAVLREGLKKMRRHHLHLSSDEETARRVGARRGRPVVLEVDARAMRRDGHDFYLSENEVWLVERVPPRYLRRL